MERPELKAQFTESKKSLESSREDIDWFLNNELLDERDALRLTRVLQLVDRYQPKREGEEEKINRWKAYLESIFRLLPTRKKPADQLPKINSASSYLLAEKTIATLRELRHLDFNLEETSDFSADEILNQERSTVVTSEETLDTSLTLEYEKKNWGVERICLDGIQNHLPADAKGEHVWVRCLIDGQWVSLAEARPRRDKIEAVRFSDDGVGFDVKNLSLLHSFKTEEKESAGQFGEGMKMMAAAALREGLQPEMESQDWRAKPIAKAVNIFDTRNKKDQTVQQLAFQVQHLDGQPLIGSRTTFWKPSESFLDELMKIDSKVLPLKENYRPLFVGSTGEIVSSESGNIFVKGMFVCRKKTLLSYNLEDVETNRDRNAIVSDNLEYQIRSIIMELSDKRLVKTMLQKCILEPETIESNLYNLHSDHPSVWLEGFYEAFGQDAVLDTDFKIPDTFKDQSIKKIKLQSGLKNILLRAGVRTDKDVTPDFWQEIIPTSLTLEYGKNIWTEERILLDAVQNHLPKDSGGSNVFLRFKTKDGQWHHYSDLADVPDEQIESLKICDDGRGYNARLLGFLYSTKDTGEGSGKFGEGLKMLCVAALRKKIEMTLRSQDWTARPRASRQEVDDKQIDQLMFDVTHSVKERELDDDKAIHQISSTTFEKPTAELLKEFRQINKKVLAIERVKPVEHTANGDLLSLEGGLIYVREILIPGDHNLLFTYHLPTLEIKNRDRSFIDEQELTPAIADIWSQIKNPEAIKGFLFKANLAAQKGDGRDKLEFTMDFDPQDAQIWKKCFEEVFGKDTAIRDMRSEDYDALQQNKHVGLELISLPTEVYQVLRELGLPTYESRLHDMTDVEHIPDAELTPEELAMIDILKAIDDYLPNNKPSGIKIYRKKTVRQRVANGFSDGKNIHLLRDILEDFIQAADVYVHEKVHHNTEGALDASQGFRNYLSLALSRLALDQLKKVRPDLVANTLVLD